MRTIPNKLVIILLLAVLLIILVRQYAGQFLVVNQSPQNADVIIVLSGNPDELITRMEHACFLYQSHYAPHLIISGENIICKVMRNNALKEGIPSEAIITEDNSFSTYENALHTKEVMVSYGFKSAIIVSSEYHMRRTKFLFDNIYRGTGITLLYCSAQSPFFNPRQWWDNKQSIEITINEYIKLIANGLGIYSRDNNDKAMLNHLNEYLFH